MLHFLLVITLCLPLSLHLLRDRWWQEGRQEEGWFHADCIFSV